MKRAKLLLCSVCIFALMLCAVPASAVSANIPVTPNTTGNGSDKMEYYPFVYSEEEGFAWVEELIGDCSSCLPGYLYVQKLSTGERWQVLDQPVDLFRSSGETLYCIVDGSDILQTNYWGQAPIALYNAAYGNIDNLEFLDDKLYFSDADRVICLDLHNHNSEELAVCDGITFLFPLSANAFVWSGIADETYRHNIDTGIEEPVDLEELFAEDAFSEAVQIDHSDAVAAVPSGMVRFPLSEYPTGSYFTKNGLACTSHSNCSYGGCNCICYRNAIQCAGFAMYAFDRYSNLYPNSASWYSNTDSHSNVQKRWFNTDENVRLIFSSLGYGAYMRLGRPGQGDVGVHSIVTAGTTGTSVTIYEGNYDGQCRVRSITYTFAQFRARFNFVEKTVAHNFTGTAVKYSADYHRVPCSYSGCAGYILQGHYAQSPGANVKCLGCGYVGNISTGVMSAGGADS